MRNLFSYRSLLMTLLSLSLATTGCSGTSSDSSESGGVVANIYGLVTLSSGSSSFGRNKLGKAGGVSAQGVSGCSVVARDLDTNAIVATATSDANGHYTLTGSVTAGENYKITATCGSNVLSSVAKADMESTSSKEPVTTNPRSTIIAAMIVQAIVEAVNAATSGLSDSVKAVVKESILAAIDSVVQSITETIEEAIETGAMEEPSVTEATDIGGDLDTADYNTNFDTVVLDGYTNDIPTSVTGAVDGAKAAASALPGCDSSIDPGDGSVASETKCIKAVAKLIYNVLHFGVLLNNSGVYQSEISGGCNDSNAQLTNVFQNAKFQTNAQNSDIPAGYCYISSKVGQPDRNRGFENGSDDHGPEFAETGNMDGVAGNEVGVINAIGSRLYAKTVYNLSDIDELVFSMDTGTKSGMGMKLLAQVEGANGARSIYYRNSSGSWTNNLWPAVCDNNYDGNANEPCRLWDIDFGFTGLTWDTAVDNGGTAGVNEADLGDAIHGGNNVDLNVFYNKFGGNIPSQSELDEFIDQGRIHLSHNPSGQKEFWVLYSKAPKWDSSNNGCWDNDPSTACLGHDDTQYPAVKVDLTLAANPSADGRKRITDVVENNSTGAFYVVPYYSGRSWSGLVSFINVTTGKRMLDEFLKERAILVVTDVAQCDGAALPAAGANCAVGYMFNATIDWSQCRGPGTPCPDYAVLDGSSATPVENGSNANMQINIDTDFSQNFYQFFNGTTFVGGHSMIVFWGENGHEKMTVTLANGTSDTINAVGTGDANAGINKYNVAAHFAQSGNEWNIDGFYLVDENGGVYERAGATSKWASGQVCEINGASQNCALSDAVKYLATNAATYGLNSYGAIDFHPGYDADGNSGNGNSIETFTAAVGFFKIYNGPVLNPYFKCSLEPYFVDLNGDGDLNCNANDNAAVTDVSFSDRWEYDRWVSKPGNTNAASPLISRENGYAFGDPVGTKKLLTTAFNGWFDGAHTLSQTTSLNALQAFSLVVLFFTEGSDGQRVIPNISGLPAGANDMFYVESPLFMNEGSGNLSNFNVYIGNALNNFHQ